MTLQHDMFRYFETRGPVSPDRHYVVSRQEELADFVMRVKEGRYIVLFAPRQTGKTTFFRAALKRLSTDTPGYFPIQLNFERYEDWTRDEFYRDFYKRVHENIVQVFEQRDGVISDDLHLFLSSPPSDGHVALLDFFQELGTLLREQVVLVLDEFDAIPSAAIRSFLRTLRYIYLTGLPRCPHSVGIVGVKNITQLNYDRSISPFNIQDEFHLPNFSFAQVRELLAQYTAEVGQPFETAVIEMLHRQTGGQPVLVNHLAQILTEKLGIPKTEPVTLAHFAKAHTQLLRGRNTHIQHLTTNIRLNPRFEQVLMQIASYDKGMDFNLDDEVINELATYGVLVEGKDGMCEIANPIYLYRILRTFHPLIHALEREYFPDNTEADGSAYLTAAGHLNMVALLDNFSDFIARAGFRILQVPETPQEFVGQYLLLTYLDNFVRLVQGTLQLEVQTGRGRIDLLIMHQNRKYIVETKIWQGEKSYEAGKQQLAAYLKLEGGKRGYYVVFDYRKEPVPRTETETIDDVRIRSYVIPVVQVMPSTQQRERENP